MPPTGSEPRRHRSVVAAGVVAVLVLALGTSVLRFLAVLIGRQSAPVSLVLASPVSWPAGGGRSGVAGLVPALGQAVLLAVVVGLTCWLASRSGAGRRGFWAVLLGGWLGVVVGSYLAAPLVAPSLFPDTTGVSMLAQGFSLAGAAAGWAIASGWLVGLVAGLARLRLARSSLPVTGPVDALPG